ncbi:unnamed protein product [Arctia plantaginis]|uniref:Uncharacterized protein n=1 Tax=Arctia plantaginis TaxID=874455 RepID=A0A8S1BN89_ARCPL|nr:unnamed protein product [Arctia plantaginis]
MEKSGKGTLINFYPLRSRTYGGSRSLRHSISTPDETDCANTEEIFKEAVEDDTENAQKENSNEEARVVVPNPVSSDMACEKSSTRPNVRVLCLRRNIYNVIVFQILILS